MPLPVQTRQGDIICKAVAIEKDLIISDGIYRAENGISNLEVSNYTDTDRLVYVEQAVESIPYKKEEVIELHTITSDTYTAEYSRRITKV